MNFAALQLAPVKAPAPSSSPAVAALTAGFQQLSAAEQAQLFDNLIATPGGDAANKSENFDFTWVGLSVGVLLGVVGLMAVQHLKGE